MNPVNFYEEDGSRVVLNGPRPSPLRIGKDSHVIQKPSSSHQIANNIASQVNATKQQRQPVIIYTRSPKIIHTKPRDFMALVQKLTGFSRTQETKIEGVDINDHHQSDQERQQADFFEEKEKHISHEDNESSSVTSEEKYEGENNKGVQPYMAEIPLFTPNSSNLFFSPQGLLRNPDTLVPSPGIVGSLSPSFLEFLNMKELPEY